MLACSPLRSTRVNGFLPTYPYVLIPPLVPIGSLSHEPVNVRYSLFKYSG